MPFIANRANLVNESVLGDGLRQQVLTCSTGGAAVSSVEWHRNGMQLDKGDNSKYKGANLFIDFTILNIVLEDEGVYSCTYNDGDPGSTQYCLEIEGGHGCVCCGRGRILVVYNFILYNYC